MTDHIGDTNEMVPPDHIRDATKLMPGPELDRLISEKIMGWKLQDHNGYIWRDDPLTDDTAIPWSPSTNIAHAFEVVEKMKSLGKHLDRLFQGSTEPWWCGFLGTFQNECAETAPHAICLAALKAVGK